MSIMTTPTLALVGAIVFCLPCAANADVIGADAARQFVEHLGNRTVDASKLPGNAGERSAGFTGIMLDSLDFDAIGLYVLGKLSRVTTPEQRREFTPLFTAYVIDVAIESLGDLQIRSFGLGGVALQPNGDAKVHTRIATANRTMEVHWRVRNTGGTAKIADIEIEGASLAVHYHGEFDRVGAATVPQLIARLKELTKDSRTLAMVRPPVR